MTRRSLRTFGRPLGAAVLLGVGLVARAFGTGAAPFLWWTGLVALGFPVLLRTAIGVLHGRFAADVVASLSILCAALLDQPLPGLVIVLMQTGGEALDRYAEGRASAAVRALEGEAPRLAHRLAGQGWEDVAVERIAPGDILLVRPGEMVPCDGTVRAGDSTLDTSRLTGEAIPRRVEVGSAVDSGVVNLTSPFEFVATRRAAESQYAMVVRLVRDAQASKSPLQREADRWAVWFTPLTLACCGIAWVISGDPLRVLAVLVVATPCPLILAAPVAVIGGIDRGARLGLVFRTGAALEGLGRASTIVLDKTGTLTVGHPEVARISAMGARTPEALLALAAAVEVGAGHPLARSVVDAAARRGIRPSPATAVVETPGRGVEGVVDGVQVAIGARSWIAQRIADRDPFPVAEEELAAFVAIDGRVAGTIAFADALRPEAPGVVAALRDLGFTHPILLSGDHPPYAQRIGRALGIDDARGGQTPKQKLDAIRSLQGAGERVVMVGDGTNDAPALSAAEVGVALAAHGGGVSAEAAGLVLLRDDLGALPLAVRLSRRTLRVARQSIVAGLGLSFAGMLLAGAGQLSPVAGAFAQELIDVAVILWALRASAPLSPELPGS